MRNITHIQSTQGEYWRPQTVGTANCADDLVLSQSEKQTMLGFGGCFNELGWDALGRVSEEERKQFLDELFLPENCNFNYGRVPIGANDFSLEWYSCDETRDDFELKDFNIERDKTYTIPFIKEAIARQGKDFFVFGSPWSPPTWMKTKPVYNFGTLRMEEKILQTYARYFVRFIEEYRKEGVRVGQVHVQNEPMADQKFPSCKWTGKDMRDFIKGYLGPALRESGLDTELWLGTINGPFVDMMFGANTPFGEFYDQFINTILSDPQARSYLTGVGLQWGGKHVLEHVEASYPEMRVMQTESECGDGQNSWTHMEYIAGLMWQYFRHGAERYTYWNMALLEGGVSSWGWAQNSLCTVNPETGALKLQPEFYLMKHYSHFVQPGAKYIPVTGHLGANCSAFRNPDGSLVIVAASNMEQPREFTVRGAGEPFSVKIAPHSISTILVEE